MQNTWMTYYFQQDFGVPWTLYYPIMPNSHDVVTSSLFMSTSHTKTSFTYGSDILFQSK